MKINVLGTEYEIITRKNHEDPKLTGADGYAELMVKRLVVADQTNNADPDIMDGIDEYTRRCTRHEIVHAFMYESGLYGDSGLGRNELLVDWIALQIPKMVKAMTDAGCLDTGEIDRRIADRGMGVDQPVWD